MPDRDVTLIGDLIYYQYAKIIAKSAFGASDRREAKGRHYGPVKRTLRELGRETRNSREISVGGEVIYLFADVPFTAPR